MEIINNETYRFVIKNMHWTLYDKEQAEWLDQQLKDAKRYQWVRGDQLCSPEEFDQKVDAAMGLCGSRL